MACVLKIEGEDGGGDFKFAVGISPYFAGAFLGRREVSLYSHTSRTHCKALHVHTGVQ